MSIIGVVASGPKLEPAHTFRAMETSGNAPAATEAMVQLGDRHPRPIPT